MQLFLFLLVFIILLVVFLVWQHRYFHPASLHEIDERERKLLKQATKEINEARKIH